MKIKLLVVIAVVAVAGLLYAQAADDAKLAADPRIDKLIQQNEKILQNQSEILKQLAELKQDLLQLRRRSS